MSIETSVTIKRGKTQNVIGTGVEVQLDNISEFVIASSGGAIPNNSYTLISLGGAIPDIKQGDLLMDEGTETWNLDTVTKSGKAEYRASGTPAVFPYDHLEIRVTRYVEQT